MFYKMVFLCFLVVCMGICVLIHIYRAIPVLSLTKIISYFTSGDGLPGILCGNAGFCVSLSKVGWCLFHCINLPSFASPERDMIFTCACSVSRIIITKRKAEKSVRIQASRFAQHTFAPSRTHPQHPPVQVGSRPENYQNSLHDLNDIEECSDYQPGFNPSSLLQRRRESSSRFQHSNDPPMALHDNPPMARQLVGNPRSLQDIPVRVSGYFSCQ